MKELPGDWGMIRFRVWRGICLSQPNRHNGAEVEKSALPAQLAMWEGVVLIHRLRSATFSMQDRVSDYIMLHDIQRPNDDETSR